ncbi:SDR family oxidoreductase [Moorella sulfitireducens]|uniref:SDR family oxidoreductase n=1 Tax=Neomoorella sulfitireducens TaxID=2972948 RepID=UPI0021AC8AFF|nr:SDR family oxidoreductase [Moorella sulfitireducens]
MKDLFGYTGKNIIIDGAASGMGLATVRLLVELGANVWALDIKDVPVPVKKFILCDLSKKDSIDSVIEQLPDDIDRVFCCAGLPGAPFSVLDVMSVNFIGHRYLIETLLNRMKNAGAVAIISSLAGMEWMKNYQMVGKMLATSGFEEAVSWVQANEQRIKDAGGAYGFSKQCLCAYVALKAMEFLSKGVRINSLSPAPTQTPMMPYFEQEHGQENIKAYSVGGRYATPEEMAEPLLFLNSDMARFITGFDLKVDNGFVAGMIMQQLGALK